MLTDFTQKKNDGHENFKLSLSMKGTFSFATTRKESCLSLLNDFCLISNSCLSFKNKISKSFLFVVLRIVEENFTKEQRIFSMKNNQQNLMFLQHFHQKELFDLRLIYQILKIETYKYLTSHSRIGRQILDNQIARISMQIKCLMMMIVANDKINAEHFIRHCSLSDFRLDVIGNFIFDL